MAINRYLSGIQATGIPHIGNYVGAIKHWVDSQNSGVDSYYMIADLHAITVPMEPDVLRSNRLGAMAGLIACGLDPRKVVLFFQSDVPSHTEMSWLLSGLAYVGELRRMTQFKAKSPTVKDSASMALFGYPVLQAADILLYQADGVPVGEDQVQHIELTRNIAQRFNSRFGEVFTLPLPVVPTLGARVMDLQDPTKKMSKSGNAGVYGVIYLNDKPDEIVKKISRAVTDSLGTIVFDDRQPGLKNILTLLATLNGESVDRLAERFSGQGYGALKKELAEITIATLDPIRRRIDELLSDPDYIRAEIQRSCEAAKTVAAGTLRKAKDAMGF